MTTNPQRLRQPSGPERKSPLGRANVGLILGITAVAGLSAMAANSFIENQEQKNPEKPVGVEAITDGTLMVIPNEDDDGWRNLILEESTNSHRPITEEQLDMLTDQSREMNEGEPQIGEQVAIPNIVDLPPPTSSAP